ncbi:MAG: GNAT family N-acetyltransferase [Acidobacteriota bacterium]
MTTSDGFPDAFATARMRAERLRPVHIADLLRMDSDPRVMEHLGGVRNESQTAAYLERNLRHWDEHGFGLWMLREHGRDDVIGRAVLRHLLVEGVDEVEVGYCFYPAFWGRGLATEITRVCLDFARNRLRRATVVGVTTPGNLASQHVLVKNGLVYEREFLLDTMLMRLFRKSWDLQQ